MIGCTPTFIIRACQAGDYQNARRIVASGTMELVMVAFEQAIHSLSNVCLLFASGQVVYVITGSLTCSSLICLVLLALIYLACWQVYASYLRERMETDMAHIEEYYLKPPGAGFWVAMEEEGAGEVVGTVGVKMEPGDPHSCQLFRLFVDQRFCRHGLGRRLTQKVLDFAKHYGYRSYLLKTTSVQEPAICMYQKMGFQIQSSSPVPGPVLLRF
ncbi:N-acetylaspartate synthetase-like [Rhincodon typus]|uniref:N-acetylaspartate synthetase-like n=1 Tax=Rhincodon typus TaxID=259920 RepID=UPI00202EEB36|nr:N-acetylaspartate synthetase-like [Rhincodon typus]